MITDRGGRVGDLEDTWHRQFKDDPLVSKAQHRRHVVSDHDALLLAAHSSTAVSSVWRRPTS